MQKYTRHVYGRNSRSKDHICEFGVSLGDDYDVLISLVVLGCAPRIIIATNLHGSVAGSNRGRSLSLRKLPLSPQIWQYFTVS